MTQIERMNTVQSALLRLLCLIRMQLFRAR
jgi:hypothetical protein